MSREDEHLFLVLGGAVFAAFVVPVFAVLVVATWHNDELAERCDADVTAWAELNRYEQAVVYCSEPLENRARCTVRPRNERPIAVVFRVGGVELEKRDE